MTLRAEVLLPASYDRRPTRRYPVIYWFFGFGGDDRDVAERSDGAWMRAFAAVHREAIVVVADPVFDGYYTEFADSVNNGPWGAAFTSELVPAVDARFRTDGRRYLAGHSSGGWAALWLEVNDPDEFGGAWAYAPDPVDFHDFLGPDLTVASPGNLYYDVKHTAYLTDRVGIRDQETIADLVNGRYGTLGPKQYASFESVFSPRGANGLPAKLFDRKTGTIDPSVAAYWERHYDLNAIVRRRWPKIGSALVGKLHVTVGTDDTFHLDDPVRLFATTLDEFGAHAEVTYVKYGNHWNILDWDGGYARHVAREALEMDEHVR